MSSVNEWPMVKLGEVVEINPKLPTRPVDEEEITFVPMAAVEEDGFISSKELRPYGEVKKGYTSFLKDDLLVAKITPCFQNKKIAAADIDTAIGIGSTEFHVLRASENINPKYLLHFLRQDSIISEGEECMTGSGGQRRVPKWFMENVSVPLPPLAEQQRIADILDLTSTITHRIEKQLSLFAKISMSYASSCLDSAITAPLSKFGTFSGGMTPSKKNSAYWGGTVRWFTTKDLKESVLKDSIDHVTERALEETSLKRLPSPSVAFSLRGMSLAHTVPMSRIPASSTVNQDLKAFIPHNPEAIRVLYALIRAKSPWLLSKVSTSGHGTKKLDFTYLQNLELPQLSTSDFTQLDQALTQIEELEQEKNKELEALRSLYQSLSSRAFTGHL